MRIAAAKGDFKGRYKERAYDFDIQATALPSAVKLNGAELKRVSSKAVLANATEGYFFDSEDRGGRLTVKTAKLPTDKEVTLTYTIR